jgi:uncharacterized protein YuzE
MFAVNQLRNRLWQPICSFLFGTTMAKPHPGTAPLKLKYEAEYDLLSVWVTGPEPADNIEVEPGVYVRVSRSKGQVVGLEVIEATERLHKPSQILKNPTFARKLLEKYARRAHLTSAA